MPSRRPRRADLPAFGLRAFGLILCMVSSCALLAHVFGESPGRFPAGGIAYLAVDAAAAGSADSAQAEDAGGSGIAGSWAFARGADGSDQLCEVNMSDETGSSGLPALAPQAGCSDAITVLDLAGWKLDGGRLSVHDSSGKERLSFSQKDGPVWIRDPAGSRPLFLIRTGE